MRLFPDLRYWVPEADILARERKTMKSYQDLLRPATPGKSRNSPGLDPSRFQLMIESLSFPINRIILLKTISIAVSAKFKS
jgi:hypothetical protein